MGLFSGLSGLFGGGGDGGIGNSKSTNATNEQSNDASIVSGASSTNLTSVVSGANNNITYSDQGAIKGALDLALKGVEGAYSFADQAQASQGSLVQGALQNAAQQQQQFTAALENIKTSDVRVLIVTGLVVVGMAAAFMFKKKG